MEKSMKECKMYYRRASDGHEYGGIMLSLLGKS